MWITFLASAPESGDSISDSPPDFERLADHLEQSAWWRGKLQAWPTPTTQDASNTAGPSQFRRNSLPLNACVFTEHGPQDQEKLKQTGNRPVLSPAWVETLMGFPIGWTDCGR